MGVTKGSLKVRWALRLELGVELADACPDGGAIPGEACTVGDSCCERCRAGAAFSQAGDSCPYGSGDGFGPSGDLTRGESRDRVMGEPVCGLRGGVEARMLSKEKSTSTSQSSSMETFAPKESSSVRVVSNRTEFCALAGDDVY
jgi:hypothetical protein